MKVSERVEALRKLMAEKGIDAYVVPTADFHQTDPAAGHLVCSLEEIAAIGPKSRVVSCDNGGSIGSGKACDKLSGLKVFPDIFTLMKISGGYNIGVDTFLCH